MVLRYIQTRKDAFIKCGILAGCITAFLIPFPRSWVLYAMGIFLICSLLIWISDFKIHFQYLARKWYFFVPFVLYFFLQLIYSIIEGFDWSFIEKRFMFLLLPLIGVSILSSEAFASKRLNFIKAFILGLLAASVILIVRACLIALNILEEPVIPVNALNSGSTRFFPGALSFFQHPSYFSMELNLGVILLAVFRRDIKFKRWAGIVIVILFSLMIFLVSSRAGIMAFILSGTFILFKLLGELRLGKIYSYLLASALILTLLLVAFLNPKVSESVKNIKEKLISSRTVRLIDVEPRTRVWYTSLKLIREYPLFGVGIREIDNKQVREYRRNNFYAEAYYSLNAHNQFLEAQLTMGVAGTFLLLWMIFAPLLKRRSLLNSDLFFSFLIIVLIHFMFESMLVRQWGVMFFVLFSCFQVYLPVNKEIDED